MIVTLRDFLKRYQNSLNRPDKAASNHARSVDTTPFQTHEEPMPSIVIDPVLSQARAEEQFFSEQFRSGYQLSQSGIIESAADEANMRLYQAHNNYFSPTEQAEQQVEPMPELQQPSDAPGPMPHPWTFGIGGW